MLESPLLVACDWRREDVNYANPSSANCPITYQRLFAYKHVA